MHLTVVKIIFITISSTTWMYTMAVQKYQTLMFPWYTNQAREISFGGDVEGTFMCRREFFPTCR